jgi:hypothetical protein
MKFSGVVELIKIANVYLPRVKLEYDRLRAELNSWKVEISNAVRVYQGFCDRNLELKKREDELLKTINELEAKNAELQKARPIESMSEFRDRNADNTKINLNSEAKDEGITIHYATTLP